jgi:SAM-dependent methyltransferase
MRLIVGCGPKPVPEGWVGIDINPDYVRQARSVSPSRDVFLGDATNLSFEDNSVDEIVCWEVLEHIEDKERAIQEFHRVSKPSAKLVLTTPLRHIEEQLSRISRNYRQSVLETQHQFCVSPEETLELIGGFYRIEKVWNAPEAFAYCYAVARLLDRHGVVFNDAGNLVGEHSDLVHQKALRRQRLTSWYFRLINRMRPFSATKSICLAATCAKHAAA